MRQRRNVSRLAGQLRIHASLRAGGRIIHPMEMAGKWRKMRRNDWVTGEDNGSTLICREILTEFDILIAGGTKRLMFCHQAGEKPEDSHVL